MVFTESIWQAFADTTDFPALQKERETDVAVVGGGITGITTALLLAEKGLRVLVLEAFKVGAGTTGHSTGNLYCTVDKMLSSLLSSYDAETVRRVVDSRRAAMGEVERFTTLFGLDCDFHRRPWYLFSAVEEADKTIDEELSAARVLGLEMMEVVDLSVPLDMRRGARLMDQAQLNPQRYVQQLAKAAQGRGCEIYENTRVTNIENQDDHKLLRTTGGTVKANRVVLATHTPKGVRMVHTMLGPYREYGIAARLRTEQYPEGIYWGYYQKDSQISIRSYHRAGQSYLVVVGKPHKVGQEDSNVRAVMELEQFARQHFDVEEITHRWGGQHYRPADHLPYIGPAGRNANLYIATGFSTDGLTYGTLSGMIISDQIAGVENAWEDLYRPTRIQPLKSAREFVKENINVAVQYVKDFLGGPDVEELSGIAAGEGRVVEIRNQKIAAYREENGALQMVSAVCTHMGCIVNWNEGERSWDCPCHGSRFGVNGEVLEGPAFNPLAKIEGEGSDEPIRVPVE